jgi:hypothetical protein
MDENDGQNDVNYNENDLSDPTYSQLIAASIIQNILTSVLAEKLDTKQEYLNINYMNKLGLTLFTGGIKRNHQHKSLCNMISNKNIMDFLIGHEHDNDHDKEKYYLEATHMFSYTSNLSYLIRILLYTDEQQKSFYDANFYKRRMNNNNDVFVHVHSDSFDYYDKILSSLEFIEGYLFCDLKSNYETVTKLYTKYRVRPMFLDPIEILMFASTCKHIVLSNNCFSWILGVISFHSNIYYPQNSDQELFVFDDWISIIQ